MMRTFCWLLSQLLTGEWPWYSAGSHIFVHKAAPALLAELQ